jgi:hypothetical protein
MADQPIIVRFDRRQLHASNLVVTSERADDVALLAVADHRTDPELLASLTDADPAHRHASLPMPATRRSSYIAVRSLHDADAEPVTLRVRQGSETGAIVAEMQVIPLAKIRVRVKPHLVRIDGHRAVITHGANGQVTAFTAGHAAHGTTGGFDVAAILEHARAVWAPSGVELWWRPEDLTATSHFTVQAEFTDYVNSAVDELHILSHHARDRFAINLYMVQRFAAGTSNRYSIKGLGVSREHAAQTDAVLEPLRHAHRIPASSRFNTGIFVARAPTALMRMYEVLPPGSPLSPPVEVTCDPAEMGHAVAHEIGHFFGLSHTLELPAATPVPGRVYLAPGGTTIFQAGGPDVWQVSRLMYPMSPFDSYAPYRMGTSFGQSTLNYPSAGFLLSFRNLAGLREHDPTPEYRQARDFIRRHGDAMYDLRNADPAALPIVASPPPTPAVAPAATPAVTPAVDPAAAPAAAAPTTIAPAASPTPTPPVATPPTGTTTPTPVVAVPRAMVGDTVAAVVRTGEVSLFLQRFPGDEHAGPVAERAIDGVHFSYRRLATPRAALPPPTEGSSPGASPPTPAVGAATPAYVQAAESTTSADGGVNLVTGACPAPAASGGPAPQAPNELWLFQQPAPAAGAASPVEPYVERIPLCTKTPTELPAAADRPAHLYQTLLWAAERLEMLGYEPDLIQTLADIFAGPAEFHSDMQTVSLEAAVLAFQWDNGLTVNGRLDAPTLDALVSATTPRPRAGGS